MAYRRLAESVPPQTELLRDVLYFNGSNAYVEVPDSPNLDITDAITIEAWVKVTGPGSGTNGSASWISREDKWGYCTYTGRAGWGEFSVSPTSRQFVIARASDGYKICVGYSISMGEWVHLVTTAKANDKVRVYKNGELASTSSDILTDGIANYNSSLLLGRHSQVAWYFNGITDSVRIYNRALTDEEIQEHAAGEYTDSSGLVLYLPLNESSGSVANDLSGNGNNGTIYNASWQKDTLYTLSQANENIYRINRGNIPLSILTNYAKWLPKNDEFELVVHNLTPSCTYYVSVNTQEVGYFTTDNSGYAKVYISQDGVFTEPAPKYALITINSTPTGAVIKIDGEETNLLTPETLLFDPGTYTVTLSKAGYLDFERTITATAGEEKTYSWTMMVAPTPTPRIIEIEVERARVDGAVDIDNSRIPATIITDQNADFRIRVVNTGTAYAKYRVTLRFLGPSTYNFTSDWSETIDPGKYKSIYLTVRLPDEAVPEGQDSAIYTLESILEAEKVTPTPTPTPSPSPTPSP